MKTTTLNLKLFYALIAFSVLCMLVLQLSLTFAQNAHAQTSGSSSFSFSAGGDHSSTSNANTTANLNNIISQGVNFHLGVGDMSYMSPGTETQWCDYVKSKVGTTFPFQIVSGNHESDGLNGLIDNFAACLPNKMSNIVIGSSPSGTSPSYTSEYGKEYYFDYPQTNPIARMIMVSPNLTFTDGGIYNYTVGNSHYTWLSNAIDSARASGIKWVIVGEHKNCITLGVKPCEVGADFMNLLISKKVDVILQGHEHNYQRSKQLAIKTGCSTIYTGTQAYNANCVVDDGSDNQYTKGLGPVIVIVGTFGAGQVNLTPTDPEAPYFVKYSGANVNNSGSSTNPTYGFTKFSVTETAISAQFIRGSGGTFTDSFTIADNGNLPPTPTPTASPTALPTPTVPPTSSPTPLPTPTINPTASPTSSPTGCQNVPTTLGSVTDSVNVPTTGAYEVWSRLMASSDSSNAYYLQIDNECPVVVGDLNGMAANSWTWVDYQNGSQSSKININLTAGTHSVKMIGKEAGTKLDKVLLTADLACQPIGNGDNCLAQSVSPTPLSTPTIAPTSTPTLSPTSSPTAPPQSAPPTPTPPSDITAPTVSITSPLSGSLVTRKSNTIITANAADNFAVNRVEFRVEGTLLCSDATAPYSCAWTVPNRPNSSYTLEAKSFDSSNNISQPFAIQVTSK